ncbi:MAG: DUF3189 family protein [Firmicutes bacterium]|nr:DUF3189 family protein [Bacillota bacterium]
MAAIHLGFLPSRVSTQAELEFVRKTAVCIPWHQGCTKREYGSLIFIGHHPPAEVYILPVGKKAGLVLKTFTAAVTLLGDDPINYRLVDCETVLKKRAKNGVFLSRLSCTTYNLIGSMVTAVQKGLTE